LALRVELGVERAGLEAGVVGLDLGEKLGELGQNPELGRLGIGRVDDELALGFGLGEIGAGLEALDLLWRGAEVGFRGQGRPRRHRGHKCHQQRLHILSPTRIAYSKITAP
jgi:hypothetical protein